MLLSFFVEHTMHVLLKYYYISEIRLRNFYLENSEKILFLCFVEKHKNNIQGLYFR